MAFNVFEYNERSTSSKEDDKFWTQHFIRKVDSFLPRINQECEFLVKYSKPNSEDAFKNKILAWKDLMLATKRLCQLYKINDAQCLSKKN